MAAQDVRSLLPRVRRAVEGPFTLPPEQTLNDSQVEALAADAIADIILFTYGEWGHKLAVTDRNVDTAAPEHWSVDPELEPEEESVIAAQAAIQYFFHAFRDTKVSETIKNEGREWTYSLSANVLKDQIALLREQRDKALEAVVRKHPVMARYASLLEARDPLGSVLLEPFVANQGIGGHYLLPLGFQG